MTAIASRPMAAPVSLAALLMSALLGVLGGGCASPPSGSSAPKPGQGIAEYRAATHEARGVVVAVVKALDTMAQSPSPESRLSGFDRALHRLEVDSVKTRARAEAILARGQAYFEEWKGQLAGVTNQADARVDEERYTRMHRHFDRIRDCSKDVREEFRPFMGRLREFRARLDQPASAGREPELSRSEVEHLAADGHGVIARLEAVAAALDEAQAALRAVMADARREVRR